MLQIMSQSDYCVLFVGGVRPVCLPSPSESFPPGAACWITGWGYLHEGGVLRWHTPSDCDFFFFFFFSWQNFLSSKIFYSYSQPLSLHFTLITSSLHNMKTLGGKVNWILNQWRKNNLSGTKLLEQNITDDTGWRAAFSLVMFSFGPPRPAAAAEFVKSLLGALAADCLSDLRQIKRHFSLHQTLISQLLPCLSLSPLCLSPLCQALCQMNSGRLRSRS